MPLEPKGAAPYTSATAAVAALDAYRDRGLGTPITPEILTRAGVPESIARRTLQSLITLELIGEDGRPTEQWQVLSAARGQEEYRARLQEWLRAVYADVLQYADPTTHSLDRIVEAFRSYEPAGQRRSMAALLIGLWKYAGLPVEGAESQRPPTAARRPTSRPPRAISQPRARITQPALPAAGLPVDGLPPGLLGLLQQIPTGGRTWTTTTRDRFLEAFRAVLDFSVPVDDSPPPLAIVPDVEDDQ
jgi:hypothetical protein